MSKTLTTAAVTQFDTQVKHAYQSMGSQIAATIENKGRIIGSTVRFPKMGKGQAKKRTGVASERQPMNVSHDYVDATMEGWEAPEYTDIFDQAEVPFSEVKQLAKTIAGAINRREDQQVIDAMDAEGTSLTVSTNVGGTNSALNPAKIRRAKRLLDDNAIGGGKRYYLGFPNDLEDMLGETEVTSSDFNTVKALVNGEIDTWMGFKFMWIESTRDEGGLPTAAGVNTNFAYVGDCLGHRTAFKGRVTVDWVPTKGAWLSNQDFKGNGAVVDAGGLVELSTTPST